MAHTKSAIKAMRQNAKGRERNRHNLGRMRTSVKKLRAALTASDVKEAKALLPETISLIDKSVQKGVIHQNAAARYKSRLTTQVNRLLKTDQAAS
jgi:small subunit ribosomal protein S20